MVDSFNKKLNRLMNESKTVDVLTELDDLKMFDEMITESSEDSVPAFNLNLSSLKKDLLETSDSTILKAAAQNLKENLTCFDLPATTTAFVAKTYGTSTAELLNMFESLYGSISNYHTRLIEIETENNLKIQEQKDQERNKAEYRVLAGLQHILSLPENEETIEEKIKKAHHAYPQSAHDWVSIRVEELWPNHIKDKGQAYGRAWNEYKAKH